MRYVPQKDKDDRVEGNQWLNEGTTVLWENLSVNDGSRFSQRDEEQDFYPHSRDLTLMLLRETGLEQDVLFRAYFGDAAARSLLETKVKERFGHSIDELNCFTLKLDKEWIERILRGEPETLELYGTEDEGLLAEKRKFTEIFPNVRLVQRET